MQRFIVSVLCAAVFFTGLGFLVEKTSATFRSDDKALEILRRARIAVGGDSAIGGVKSMTITGKVAKTFEVEGAARSENGEMEINFELPNKMSRKIKLGSGDGNGLAEKQVDVIVMRKDGDGGNLQWKTEDDGNGTRQFRIVKKDGTTEDVKIDGKEPVIIRRTEGNAIVSEDGKTTEADGKNVVIRRADGSGDKMRSNELFRTTLSLLLSAPEGMDVAYTYAGEGAIDGVMCDIIAANDGGSTIRLYLDKSTSLPRMMTYQAPKPFMIFMRTKDDKKPTADAETQVFTRRLEAPEMAEFQVKFSDYRVVNGLQLPFKWTQTVGGKTDETIDITGYEINPANIAEKFKEVPTRTFVRVQKDQ